MNKVPLIPTPSSPWTSERTNQSTVSMGGNNSQQMSFLTMNKIPLIPTPSRPWMPERTSQSVMFMDDDNSQQSLSDSHENVDYIPHDDSNANLHTSRYLGGSPDGVSYYGNGVYDTGYDTMHDMIEQRKIREDKLRREAQQHYLDVYIHKLRDREFLGFDQDTCQICQYGSMGRYAPDRDCPHCQGFGTYRFPIYQDPNDPHNRVVFPRHYNWHWDPKLLSQ